MPFFFSYETFARLSAAAVAFSTNAIPGEPITISPDILSCFGNFWAHAVGEDGGGNGVRPEAFASHEGAESCEGFGDAQILNLIRSFVGVERLAIGKEPRRLVVGNDAVAAEQLPRPRHRLAAFGRGERLCECRMRVRQLAFCMQLRLTHDQALRRRYVGKHLGE